MASGTFPAALAAILGHEGGFADHPADPGGATQFGITGRTLARARGHAVGIEDVRALTREEAGRIYRRLYWQAVRGDELPAGVDLTVFDLAVNSGPERAVRLLQAALAIPVDGVLGPVTMGAVRAADTVATIRRLTRLRLGFLSRLVVWPVFGRGWRRRVLAVEQAALELAGRAPPALRMSPVLKEVHVIDTKAILASRTVWVNLIGLIAVALGLLGFDTSGLDAGTFADAAIQLIAAASFVASTVFRIAATKRLAG